MPMVYDICRLEGTYVTYHVFDTEAEATAYKLSHGRGKGDGPWSEVMHREWSEANLDQFRVHDHRKHNSKETKSMKPVTHTETRTTLKPGEHRVEGKYGFSYVYYLGYSKKLFDLHRTGLMTKKEVKELSEFLAKLSDMMED